MTTLYKILLLSIKKKKKGEFHQMSLKSMDYMYFMLWFEYIHKKQEQLTWYFFPHVADSGFKVRIQLSTTMR